MIFREAVGLGLAFVMDNILVYEIWNDVCELVRGFDYTCTLRCGFFLASMSIYRSLMKVSCRCGFDSLLSTEFVFGEFEVDEEQFL